MFGNTLKIGERKHHSGFFGRNDTVSKQITYTKIVIQYFEISFLKYFSDLRSRLNERDFIRMKLDAPLQHIVQYKVHTFQEDHI